MQNPQTGRGQTSLRLSFRNGFYCGLVRYQPTFPDVACRFTGVFAKKKKKSRADATYFCCVQTFDCFCFSNDHADSHLVLKPLLCCTVVPSTWASHACCLSWIRSNTEKLFDHLHLHMCILSGRKLQCAYNSKVIDF